MLGMVAGLAFFAGAAGSGHASSEDGWIDSFNVHACELSPNGSNSYFFLEPGYQLTLEGDDDGEHLELVIIVTNETRTVDGVLTREVEERESEDGELVEISRNFMAYCVATGDIFYFGEEVDIYQDGEIVEHEGAWLAGEDGARAGLLYPAEPTVGLKYYQEVAPGVAEDRAEIISLDATLTVPAGAFENVLQVEETNPLEPGEKEFKYYAPGVGLLQDEDLKLISYVIPESDEIPQVAQLQTVQFNGETVEIPVNSTATISEFSLDEQDKSISFITTADSGVEGTTVISIGRILEGPYVVTVDGEVTDSVQVVESAGAEVTTIEITHPADSEEITVAGTNVVPEFPAYALAGVASALGAAILMTRRRVFGNRLG